MKRTTKKLASKLLATALAFTIAIPNLMVPVFAAETDEVPGSGPEISIEVVTVDTDAGADGADAVTDTGIGSDAETGNDADAGDDAETGSDIETGSDDAETETGDEADTEAGSDAETETGDGTETDTETGSDADTDTEAGSDAETGSDADTETGDDAGTGEAGTDIDDVTWNGMGDTKRPEASEDVSAGQGTSEDKISGTDKNWEIFYDADRDVYKVTFNIGSEADGTQVVDLTQALELLGQYAESGKQELEAAIKALAKPEKGDAGEAPVMGEMPEAPVEPEAPAGFDQEEPVAPVVPAEPGKPEGMDEALDGAYEDLMAQIKTDPNSGEPVGLETFDIKQFLADRGMPTDDAYTAQYAKYLNDKAYCEWVDSNWESWEKDDKFGFVGYFGDKDTLLFYGLGISVKFEGGSNGTPIVNEPEYKVDKNSDAYKAYLAAVEQYENDKADYETALGEYNAALDAYLKEHGPDSEEGKAYAEALEEYAKLKAEYDAKVEAIQAEYDAAVADYQDKLAEIEKKYADDQAAYDAAVKALKADFDRRVGANVLEPGDVKKFELFITSDSKHTYKYMNGSFTLATPGWQVNPDGTVQGFDGQILPDEYVDHHNYNVTLRCEPIQAMLEKLGMDDFDRFNGYAGYWDYDIKQFLSQYPGETLAQQLDSYILAYYGNEYATIDELVKNNPDAMKELTKTDTSGNKPFKIGNETFKVQAHLQTVKYDKFYQELFSFAFGSEADIDAILGEAKFNPATNRWEYDNDSWTNNVKDGEALKALYYYMDHKEIWQQTDAYFAALLDGGLTSEQATWTSLMMALNIDGVLTGNDWQNTKWPWYNSIKLEQMDIDFNLKKTDGETGEVITGSETEFQVWYIDKVKNEDGSESEVKMYCTQTTDDEGNISYTFVADPTASVWTENGELKIDYAMMKDIVYYLQEMTAPEGYERDTNVYIVMSEEDYGKLSDEDKAALEGTFDKFLDMTVSDDGLTVNTDFVNVKIVPAEPDPDPDTPEEPDPEDPEDPEDPDPEDPEDPDPEDPEDPEDPDPEDPEDPEEIPEEPTPLDPGPEFPETPEEPQEPDVEIPDPDVPLTDIPEEDVPKTDTPEEIDIPDEDVPLADVPQTGDSCMAAYMAVMSAVSLICAAAFAMAGFRRKA